MSSALTTDTLSAPVFILASMVSTYPDEAYAENIQTLLEDEAIADGLGQATQSFKELCQVLNQKFQDTNGLDDLRSEYIDCFDRGKDVSSLYETEYGRERAMVKGNELADIAGFYKAFGLETGGEGVQAEMIDHVAVELEFYALLLMKSEILEAEDDRQGFEIVRDARQKFLKAHLSKFIGAIGERPGVIASPFYSKVFSFCRDLVYEECKKLEVEVEAVQWYSSQVEKPEEVSCGAAGACLK